MFNTILLITSLLTYSPDNATALQNFAIKHELIDVQVRSYWCTERHYSDDAILLLDRAQRSVSLPMISDVELLPSLELCTAHYEAAYAWTNRFYEILSEYPTWPGVEAALVTTTEHYDFWHDAVTVRNPSQELWERRIALRRIYDRVGATAYFSSTWPEAVPNVVVR